MPSVYIAGISFVPKRLSNHIHLAVSQSENFVRIIKTRQQHPDTRAHVTSAACTACRTTAVLRQAVGLKLCTLAWPWNGPELEGRGIHLTPLFTGRCKHYYSNSRMNKKQTLYPGIPFYFFFTLNLKKGNQLYNSIINFLTLFMKATVHRVRHLSHSWGGHGSLTCYRTQF